MEHRAVRLASAALAALLLVGTPGAARAGGARANAAGNGFTQTFHSAPSLQPPIVFVSGRDPDPQFGDIFTDAQNSIQAGPVILNPEGQLVWFDPLPGGRFASDVTVQSYRGKPVLTYWQGYVILLPAGKEMILNHSYQPIADVRPGNGMSLTSTSSRSHRRERR